MGSKWTPARINQHLPFRSQPWILKTCVPFLISPQHLQAAPGVQRSQALHINSVVCCIWSDDVRCFRGIYGIFTALLAVLLASAWALFLQPKGIMAVIVQRLPNYYDKHIFFVCVCLVSLLHCSLHAYTPHHIRQAFTLSLFYPPLQKKDSSGWTIVRPMVRTKVPSK